MYFEHGETKAQRCRESPQGHLAGGTGWEAVEAHSPAPAGASFMGAAGGIPRTRGLTTSPWLPGCSGLTAKPGVGSPRQGAPHPAPTPAIPDDVDVAILGRQVQGAGAVGVGGVPRPGLQQGRTHVAAQKQLDHLEGGVKSRGPKKRGGGPLGEEDGADGVTLSSLGRLTPTRPNSQARSRGVLPELSTMQGLDWCCSSISDCRDHKVRSGLGRPSGCCCPRCPVAPRGGPYHIIVTVLGRQVQGDVALVGWDVHRRACLQHQLHGLLPALPGRVVQGPHAWGGGRGQLGAGARP